MAFNSPPTKTDGDLIDDTYLNTYLKDNVDYLYSLIPAARVYNDANISCTLATDNKITFNQERYDTDTIHSTSSLTSRLTAVTAGVYDIGFSGEWSTAPATFEVEFWINNTTKIAWRSGEAADKRFVLAGVQWKFAANDYVEVIVNPASTQTLLATAAYSPEFWMTRVAAG